MSLFLDERIEEQDDDPAKEKVTFIYPWIITLPETGGRLDVNTSFGTHCYFESGRWDVMLGENNCIWVVSFTHESGLFYPVEFNRQIWKGKCFMSYVFYEDDKMQIDLYSSSKVELGNDQTHDIFKTPPEFMTKFGEILDEKNIPTKKVVIFIELVFPAKRFYRPFEKHSSPLRKIYCNAYPDDMEKDINFSFLNQGNFIIKCSDGSVPAFRSVLFTSSSFFNKELTGDWDDNEIAIEHLMDVVKPVIIFFHTFCFEMPETYDLNYAQRLLKVIDYFQPFQRDKYNIKAVVHRSLCYKFVEETHNFESILRWTTIARQFYLSELFKMIVTLIITKFYFEWLETFPQDERNLDNPLYFEVFGNRSSTQKIFERIDLMYKDQLCTNVILD